jgi:hypothetical protein
MNRTSYLILIVLVALLIGGAYYLGTRQGKDVKDQENSAVVPAPAASGTEETQPEADDSVGFEVTTPITQALIDLEGTWRSETDARFTRTFRLDKSLTDRHEGAQANVTQATYIIFTGATAPEGSPSGLVAKSLYLGIDTGGTTTYYRIATLTSSRLSLTSLNGGAATAFVKVQ